MDKLHDKARRAIESGEEKFRDAAEYLAEAQKATRRRGRVLALMRKRHCPVLVETYRGRSLSGLYAPPTSHPAEVTLALREKGWVPYRIWFEPEEDFWSLK